MKIILTHNISRLGKANEIHDVADGYARNFLLPKGLAVPWSVMAANEIRTREAAHMDILKKVEQNAQEFADKLAGVTITFQAKTSSKDTLFGSINEADIVQKLSEDAKISLGAKNLLMEEHIKKVGSYSIPVKLSDSVSAQIQIEVVAEAGKTKSKKKK